MGKTIKLKNDIKLDGKSIAIGSAVACWYAGGSITWDTAWTWERLPIYGTTYNTTGFILSGSAFYVPANVKVIKVSVSASFYNNVVGGDKNIAIFKNGSYYQSLAYSNYQLTDNFYINMSGVGFVGVSQGDEISIEVNSGGTGQMNIFDSTRVVIEVME